MAKILIIDDDVAILKLMAKACSQLGHEVTAVPTGREGLQSLEDTSPDLMIVDLRIGDMNGLDIIRRTNERYPSTQVIMVTGHGSIETAVEAMRLGAFDYLTKPFELGDLLKTVEIGLQKNLGEDPSTESSRTTGIAHESVGMIGESPKVQEIQRVIRKIADSDSPILLEGEFGS